MSLRVSDWCERTHLAQAMRCQKSDTRESVIVSRQVSLFEYGSFISPFNLHHSPFMMEFGVQLTCADLIIIVTGI